VLVISVPPPVSKMCFVYFSGGILSVNYFHTNEHCYNNYPKFVVEILRTLMHSAVDVSLSLVTDI
jgi:hypothetical protein